MSNKNTIKSPIINNAEELLQELILLKQKYGSLDKVPVNAFVDGDRLGIELDIFTEGSNDEKLHSIDINVYNK